MADGKVEKVIEFKAREAVNQLNQVISLLNNMNETINKISNSINSINLSGLNNISVNIKDINGKIKEFETNSNKGLTAWQKFGNMTVPTINNFKTGMNGINSTLKTMLNYLRVANVRRIVYIFKQMGSAIYDLTKKYATYIENINLATVAYDGLENAMSDLYPFVEDMSIAFGLNESEVMRVVGLFKQMANAMQLTQEQGALLSEGLTKMAYDISSLYNITFDRALSALQSALVGKKLPLVVVILLANLFNCVEVLKEWFTVKIIRRKVYIYA